MSYIFIFLFIISILCLLISLFVFSKSVYTAHERTHTIRTTLTEEESISISQTINLMSSENVTLSLLRYETDKVIATIRIFPCIVGRSNAADIAIKNDLTISNRHIIFTNKNNSIYVEDCKSANGTYINGEKVLSKQVVNSGDRMCIGQTEITLIINEDYASLDHEPY